MSALHPFLNQETALNASYVNRLYDAGINYAEQAANKIIGISTDIPKLDFTGVSPEFIDPTLGGFPDMPTMPSKPPLVDVPIDTMPALPKLTTDTIVSDSLLIDITRQIKSYWEYRLTHATGLRPEVEQALFGRAVDRETALMKTGFDNYLANNAAMGWSSPAGQDQAAFISFEKERKAKLSDINRDIMVKQAELEQSNAQRNLESYQSWHNQLLAAKQADEENKINLFGMAIDEVIKKAQLYIDINKGWGEIFANEVGAYSAQVTAIGDEKRIGIEQITAINLVHEKVSNIAMEKLKLLSQDNEQRSGVANEASKAIAAVLGQLSATLFNSINISESFGSSKSWGYSESISA